MRPNELRYNGPRKDIAHQQYLGRMLKARAVNELRTGANYAEV